MEVKQKYKFLIGFADRIKKSKLSKDFLEKERDLNIELNRKAKKERESMKMSFNKLHEVFTI